MGSTAIYKEGLFLDRIDLPGVKYVARTIHPSAREQKKEYFIDHFEALVEDIISVIRWDSEENAVKSIVKVVTLQSSNAERNMQIFYHGSSVLFRKFDLGHVLEGDGKVKFGYGVYLTSSFNSAAHYSGVNKEGTTHYVYTVEIPDITVDNHIAFKQPINTEIVRRAENKLDSLIPEKFVLDGKEFRKFLAKKLGGGSDIQSEKLASEFLKSIGVEFITWPYNWKNPTLGTNVAVLDESNIKIVKVEQIELDAKQQLIPGSEKEVEI